MRKLKLSLGLLAFVGLSVGAAAQTIEVKIDGICYWISDTTVEVANNLSDCVGDIIIPSTITYEERIYNVTIIGEFAFAYSSITSIGIPSTIIWIGHQALSAYSLTSISVDSENPNYSSDNGILFDKDMTSLICYPEGKKGKNYVIPNSVTIIENSALSYCRDLTSITIPSDVASIEDYAFAGCYGLTSVTVQWTEPLGISDNVFYLIPIDNVKLCVPNGTTQSYRNADVWQDFEIEECSGTGIVETDDYASLRVYPNPTNGQLTINNEQLTIVSVEIYDVMGQCVFTTPNPSKGGESSTSAQFPSFGGAGVVIDVSQLPNGMYFLKIDNKVARFVKE